MRETDITFTGGQVQEKSTYECVLTGRSCGLVPVVLRRMILVPPVWFGRKLEFALPFEHLPLLAPWQYFRMVRWLIVLLIAPSAAALVIRLLDPPPTPPFILLFIFLLLSFCAAIWYALGLLLDSREVVRLLRFDPKTNTVTLRFNSVTAARRARQLIVDGRQTS
jgi:hypothetical protein